MSAEPVTVDAPVTLGGIGAAHTDVGRRREHNEDQVLVCPDLGLYAVADGMGGHDAGDVASAIVVASMQEYFWADAPLLGTGDKDEMAPGARRLVQGVHYANHEVYATSGRSAQQGGMGSTVVAMFLDSAAQLIHICHVGDSRCYRMRDNVLEQLTEDHSMINEALRLNPNLSPEILKQLPTNVVTRALGTKELVKPDVRSEPLRAGDLYLLCSDGLNGEVSDEDIAFAMADSGEKLEEACELLISMANDAGGRDNVSVLMLRITEQPVTAAAAPSAPAFNDDTAQEGVTLATYQAQPDASEDGPELEVDVDVEVDIEVDSDTVPETPLATAAQQVRQAASNEEARNRRAQRARRIADATARLDAALDELAAFDDWDEPAPEERPSGGRLLLVPEPEPLSAQELDPAPLPLTQAQHPSLPLEKSLALELKRPIAPAPHVDIDAEADRPSHPLPLKVSDQPPAQAPTARASRPSSPEGPVIEGDPIMDLGSGADAPPAPTSSNRGLRCIACGHRLGPRERFCGMCGRPCDAPAEDACPRCDKPLLEETRYCVWCGFRHGRDWE